MVKPVVFQVVGYQNSGKTTVTVKLIEALNKLGLKVATIKHHGHGGKPDVIEQKDSMKHLSAGSIASIVEGEGRIILQAENYSANLDDKIKLFRDLKPDVILIEGYKFEKYPKLLLLRDKRDLSLLNQVNNVKGIIWGDAELKRYLELQTEVTCFSLLNEKAISWTVQLIQNLVYKND